MFERNYSDYLPEQWPEVFEVSNTTETVECTDGMTYSFTPDQETATMEVKQLCFERLYRISYYKKIR